MTIQDRQDPAEPGMDSPVFDALIGARKMFSRSERISEDNRETHRVGGRGGDSFYRERWSHDKVVRSTHGVNCTGSCSWKVYVKDGVITWESQETDYPSAGPDKPEYEPRGCPRGASFSWYTYSPTRVRYPYVRSELLRLFREEKAKAPGHDPVEAWKAIVSDPEKAMRYKRARGKGGLVRASWEEAEELVAAAYVHTVKEFGPDRATGFSPIPAMSQVSFSSGARFHQLIGGSMLSFYDWYADLPPASPQVFGDQTDVPESGDWWDAAYLIMWGSNVPLTRTPDAHWMAEARYRGQKVISVAPDYAESVKFADEWLAPHPGTDAALAMAMGHTILREFYVEKQVPYFQEYSRQYTDLPFLVQLERREDGNLVPGKFLVASEAGEHRTAEAATEHADFKPMMFDRASAGTSSRTAPSATATALTGRAAGTSSSATSTRPCRCWATTKTSPRCCCPASTRPAREAAATSRAACPCARSTAGSSPPSSTCCWRSTGWAARACRGSGRAASTTPRRSTPPPGRRPSPACRAWPRRASPASSRRTRSTPAAAR